MKSYKADEKNTKLIGRYVIKDGITWPVHSGSGVEFNVTGKAAKLVAAGDSSINSHPDSRPRFAVFVDGKKLLDKTADKPEEVIELFSGNNTVTHKVKLLMLSEGECGAVGVKGINVVSEQAAPVRPTEKKDLSIEFIGDSITCAYGVEGKNEFEPFTTSTENFTKSYAYITADKLNADYSAVCCSGHGVVSAYTCTGAKDAERLIPSLYGFAGKLPEYMVEWDFDGHKNDIVVINLGTNDSSYITADNRAHFEERAGEFEKGYIDFLKAVRQKNRDSYIVCTMGTMDNDGICGHIEKAALEYSRQTGDIRITFYRAALQDSDDGYGCDLHPSEITQKKLADGLCKVIEGIMMTV